MSDTNVHRVVGNLLVGTSHFFVDTTTNQVGINTSSPSASLDVATGDVKVGSGITLASSTGTVTATGGFSGNGSGLTGVNSDSGSWVKDDTNGLIYVANSAHKVGIGIDNPSYKLDVDGDINISSTSTLRVGGTPAVFSNWSVDGSNIYRSSGNVGIGVTPGVALDVAGTIRGTGGIITGTSDALLTVTNTTTPAILRTLTTGGQVYFQSGTAATSDSRANINFTSMYNATNYLTIEGSTGNVGIGMTSPEDKLHTDNIRIGDWSGSGNGFRFSMDTNAYLRIQYMTGQTVYKDIMALRYDTGNVGIGTASPSAPLHVMNELIVQTTNGQSAAGYGVSMKSNTGMRWTWAPGNDNWLRLYGTGMTGNQYDGNYKSVAVGTFWSSGATRFSSDDRVKHFEEEIPALEIINQLNPYKYKKTSKIYTEDYTGEIGEEGVDWVWEIGLIAQDIKKIPYLEFAVSNPEDGPEGKYGLNYTNFIGLCIQGIKEVDRQLQTTKEALQTTKEDLQTTATNLQTTQTELKADLQTTRTELAEERTLHETTRTQLRNTQTELDVAKIKLLNIEARMQIIESNISKVVV